MELSQTFCIRGLLGRSTEDHTRDPFVKVILQPDESSCKTSKVRKKTLSPVFNETYTFQVGVMHDC